MHALTVPFKVIILLQLPKLISTECCILFPPLISGIIHLQKAQIENLMELLLSAEYSDIYCN